MEKMDILEQSFAQSSILVNGCSTEKFKNQKRLRQGDSLSPFLFILVVEILIKLLNKGEQPNMTTGFNVHDQISVSHLQFAGLRVNLEKSTVISLGAYHKIQGITKILNCKIKSLPFKYLGMPLGSTVRQSSVEIPIIEKMQKNLAKWKRRFLSKAHKLLLINSALVSLPICFMSFLHMPVVIEKKLISIMRDFLWGDTSERKKISWISWKKVGKPKKLGGIGIGSLRETNKASMVE
ncbi:uncharacterized protein LOC113305635 [Papaver somniferum]|uniref:uncharacterized protein LOC113305635 n=1 Tax=Papaver somniferum TaxID=3469 RepID=UPI000E6F6ABB|nr:uncharacterized protein LOC113305635 [Papaver somniferum]